MGNEINGRFDLITHIYILMTFPLLGLNKWNDEIYSWFWFDFVLFLYVKITFS